MTTATTTPAAASAADPWRTVPPSPLHRLRIRELWQFLLKQPMSFKLICLYGFFEYVRPQAIYAPLKGMPFASWAIILCAVAYLLESRRLRSLNFMDGLLLLFTLIVVASSANAYLPALSFARLMPVYLSWIIIYLMITNTVDTEKKFIVFMVLYFLWCLKMSQFGVRMVVMRGFSFSSWGLTCAPQFFHNSGECGIQLAMFFVSSLYFVLGVAAYLTRRGRWIVAIMPVSAGIAIMGSSSRGAQLALAALLIWMVLRSRQPIRMLVLAAVLAGAFYAILPEEQKDRFRTMGTDETSMTRRQYWSDGIKITRQHPIFGVGFQNWLPYYLRNYSARGQLPHNIFVEAGAELGYVGLGGFILLILGTFVMNLRTRRMARRLPHGSFLWHMAHGLDGALIGFLVGGFFVTVLYYPFFWINLAMTVALYNVTRKQLGAGRAIAPLRERRRPGSSRGMHAA